MISRICDIPEKMSFFLFGPRQTGKSTLVRKHLRPGAWEVNLLKHEEFIKYSQHPEIFRKECHAKISREGVTQIFVDEIQRVPDLLNEVQYLIDQTPEHQFILTGSSARKLKRGGANLLAGRALQRFLFPLLAEELDDRFDLDDALRFGTLPSLFDKTDELKTDILQSYVETYLKEEIQAEGLVKNVGGFSRFLNVSASQFGEELVISNIASDCQIPASTVQSYYEILEDTLIGFKLLPWRKSIRKQLAGHPKFYFFDLGVVNAINRRLQSPPDPKLRGHLFEHFVIMELQRLLRYARGEAQLFYWRTSNKAEVDLVIEKHGALVAGIEIKSGTQVRAGQLRSLRSFGQEHPLAQRYVVANVSTAQKINDLWILPWPEALKELKSFF